MRKIWIVVVALCLLGCRGEVATEIGEPEQVVTDSAIYGMGGDFGMSTFSLITDEGDTIAVTRTDSLGRDGIIIGDAEPDDRYVMLTDVGRETLVRAINLTQLEKFVGDGCKVANCVVTLGDDTLEIVYLDTDSLVYATSDGRLVRVTRAVQ